MKKFVIAALLSFGATAAQSTVIITFSGSTFVPLAPGATGGSFVRTYANGASTSVIDQAAQQISGSIAIDTVAAGPNLATAPDAYYDGNGARFFMVTFNSSGAQPVQRTVTGLAQTIDSASGLTFDLFDDATGYSYSFGLFSQDPIATKLFGTTLLPDFAAPTDLAFSVVSRSGTSTNYTETTSQGTITAITMTAAATAVPEPAAWAMMVVGIGIVGGGMRAPRRAARFRIV